MRSFRTRLAGWLAEGVAGAMLELSPDRDGGYRTRVRIRHGRMTLISGFYWGNAEINQVGNCSHRKVESV